MKLSKRRQILTDGSEVFDIHLRDGDQLIVLPAISEKDADKLFEALTFAIEWHTNELVN